jgi:hypothetical protein
MSVESGGPSLGVLVDRSAVRGPAGAPGLGRNPGEFRDRHWFCFVFGTAPGACVATFQQRKQNARVAKEGA